MNIPAVQPGQCCVCRGPDGGIGYFPNVAKLRRLLKPHEITWVCDDDLHLAKAVHHMSKPVLSRIEEECLEAGMECAGAYLDRIGHTDLALLTREQILTVFAAFEEGRGRAMREKLEVHAAPF